MPRSIIFGSTLVLTCALALPVSAGAQAIPRPSTSGSSSSGSSGSSGAGASGTSGGESGSGMSSGAASREGPSSIDNPRSSGRTAPSTSGGSRSSSSRDGGRVAPAPGGFAQRGSGGVNEESSSAITGLDLNSRFGTGTGRTNAGSGSGITGVAAARTFDLTPVSFPFYGPWGQYYPWFGSGFGYGYGYVYYDPWRYGATSWLWGRYGMWYDPWGYNPYGTTSYSSSGYSSSVRDVEPKRTGSIRLKANDKKAKVYIDGALVGIVDEFDGLSDHLELEGGQHQLELRAEGYEPYVGVLVVEAGKTLTERVSLKRVKK